MITVGLTKMLAFGLQ